MDNTPAVPPAAPVDAREALSIAIEALESIALAGMSGTGQESEEGMRDWHARRAWEFIGIAARALEPARAALSAPVDVPRVEPDAGLQPAEADLIERTAISVGMKSLMGQGAASCVYSEGCNGVTQAHLTAFTRKVALHCALQLSAPLSAPPEPPQVEPSIVQLVEALIHSKGWMRSYADAIVRDAIDRTAAPPVAVPAWMPIETAPVDEKETILICTEGLPGSTGEAFWHDGSECHGHRGEAGWFWESDRGYLLTASNANGTHWMPLPAPPAAAQGGGHG